jgi:PAS domain S-box-containing protein
MNIAVVGGGTRCRLLLEMMEKNVFHELDPVMVAVADIRDDAPGMIKAREKGIFVTNDYNDFFERDDIDLIIELTGDGATFNDILLKKKKTVRTINHRTAQLFWDVSRFSGLQEKTKAELEKTKTMYHVVINDLIQEDVMVIDLNYRILDINEKLLNKFGLEREETIGRYCYEVSHRRKFPCSGSDHPCPLLKAIELKEHSQTTHIHLDKDNNKLYCSISCYPLIENNKVVGVVEISRDITKDINLQKTLMKQDKLASIGRLSAGVAHEINNPLTTILTTSMLIQEEFDPENPIYQELQTITDEALRCRKIVTSLLDFSRQTKPVKKLNNINHIARDSIRLTQKQAAFIDIKIEQNLFKDIPDVRADKDQIQQALINIILNAIDATDPGGVVTVSTIHLPSDEAIEVAISDTGSGISDEEIHKIYDPFFTTKDSGTGLGLAITHGIVTRHGGVIKAKSKPGQGTTFTIRIPVDKGNNNDD